MGKGIFLTVLVVIALVAALAVVIINQKSKEIDTERENDGKNLDSNLGSASLREAFLGYRNALEERNLEDFKKYTSSAALNEFSRSVGGELNQDNFDRIASLLAGIYPSAENVEVQNEIISGNSATWQATEKNRPNNKATIKFVKENNVWKVNQETWEETR